MPLSTHISSITAGLDDTPVFVYGTANEVNVVLDKTKLKDVQDNEIPVLCQYPFSPLDITLTNGGNNNNSYKFYIEILFITKFEKNTQQNETLIERAMAIANRFIFDLAQYRAPGDNAKLFKWDAKTTITATPVYNKYDVNTCGIGMQFNVPLMNTIVNC